MGKKILFINYLTRLPATLVRSRNFGGHTGVTHLIQHTPSTRSYLQKSPNHVRRVTKINDESTFSWVDLMPTILSKVNWRTVGSWLPFRHQRDLCGEVLCYGKSAGLSLSQMNASTDKIPSLAWGSCRPIRLCFLSQWVLGWCDHRRVCIVEPLPLAT